MNMNYRRVSKQLIDQVNYIEKNNDIQLPRKDMIAMLAAIGIGCRMQLPSSVVDNPKEWYVQNVYPSAEEIVENLNEYCVFSMNLFFEKLKLVWMNRYRVLHEPCTRAAFYNLFNWAHIDDYSDRNFSNDEGSLVKALFESEESNFGIRQAIETFSYLATPNTPDVEAE